MTSVVLMDDEGWGHPVYHLVYAGAPRVRSTHVCRRMSPSMVKAARAREGEWQGVAALRVARGKVHWLHTCRGLPCHRIARSWSDVTCAHCLYRRACDLAGWRWTHEYNLKEVAYIKSVLGDRVEGFENRPSKEVP